MAHKELDVFLAKLQSARFTAATGLTNTNFGYFRSDAVFKPEFDFADTDYATGTFGQEKSVRGKAKVAQTLSMPVIPTGSTTEPDIGKFLACCGMEMSGPTGNVFSYAPSNTPANWKDMTVWKYSGDKASGACLITKSDSALYNVKFTGKIGEALWAEFAGMGALTSLPAAGSYVSGTLTIPSLEPAIIKTTTMTIQGATLKCLEFVLDAGNAVTMIVDGSKDYGHQGADIGKKSGKWSAKVYQASHATFNPYTNLDASTLSTMACTFGIAGSKVTITATSKTQCKDATSADDNGILIYDLAGTIIDNDWSISINNT